MRSDFCGGGTTGGEPRKTRLRGEQNCKEAAFHWDRPVWAVVAGGYLAGPSEHGGVEQGPCQFVTWVSDTRCLFSAGLRTIYRGNYCAYTRLPITGIPGCYQLFCFVHGGPFPEVWWFPTDWHCGCAIRNAALAAMRPGNDGREAEYHPALLWSWLANESGWSDQDRPSIQAILSRYQ